MLFVIGFCLGVGIMGAVWAIVFNLRAHPGKVESQAQQAEVQARSWWAKLIGKK